MNKDYLEKLFRIKFELDAKIADIEKRLNDPQCVCSQCGSCSSDAMSLRKSAYEHEKSRIDEIINLYLA